MNAFCLNSLTKKSMGYYTGPILDPIQHIIDYIDTKSRTGKDNIEILVNLTNDIEYEKECFKGILLYTKSKNYKAEIKISNNIANIFVDFNHPAMIETKKR
jgi:hypothetical protein